MLKQTIILILLFNSEAFFSQEKPFVQVLYTLSRKSDDEKEKERELNAALSVVSAFGNLLSGAIIGSSSNVAAGLPYFAQGLQQLVNVIIEAQRAIEEKQEAA